MTQITVDLFTFHLEFHSCHEKTIKMNHSNQLNSRRSTRNNRRRYSNFELRTNQKCTTKEFWRGIIGIFGFCLMIPSGIFYFAR